jgi:hypothetical protein
VLIVALLVVAVVIRPRRRPARALSLPRRDADSFHQADSFQQLDGQLLDDGLGVGMSGLTARHAGAEAEDASAPTSTLVAAPPDLDHDDVTTDPPPAALRRFCPYCGVGLIPESLFCGACGRRQS